MKIKAIILVLLLTSIQSANAEEDLYDLGKKLAICSAKLHAVSEILGAYKDDNLSKFYRERGNGWTIASVVSYMADGMKSKVAWSAANGDVETTITRLIVELELNIDKGTKTEFTDKLLLEAKDCLTHDEYVEESIRTYRRSI